MGKHLAHLTILEDFFKTNTGSNERDTPLTQTKQVEFVNEAFCRGASCSGP
ncbi:hypothetical protein PPTG_21407 [Phytophthora nicotianae INRA-310]|uniref:Uncharacterized protein n=1 Tax=Phytophthora nicotianae (strain INRA-310) TaxID=761204 RepID=W2R146_PHYN3|nr:hypothetical protein PPTG_21407 [Phytophthora nicotianae INRA-310]ETN19073.1 hypothetical protein PPTG_21407 [Phytophthora nicotianae INRA-310]